MSIWASLAEIGEDDNGTPDGTVLTYQHSGITPDPDHLPGSVGLSVIPGHLDGNGQYLRLHAATWMDAYARPMICDGATVILTRAAAIALRDQLAEILDGEVEQ